MKQSNHIPSPNRLSIAQKQLIESYFCGENSKNFTDAKGIVLNKTWQISELTGINEFRVVRYLNRLIEQKIKKMNNEN